MIARTRLLATHANLATRLTLAAIFASAAFLLLARESDACVLPPPPTVLEQLQESSHVYTGKIDRAYPERGGEIYEFKVERVWKGPLHESSFLYKPVTPARVVAEGTSCERVVEQSPLNVGSEYLVFASGDLAGSVRGRYEAIEVMAVMGEGQVPVPGSRALLSERIRRAMAAEERAARIRFAIGAVMVIAVTATCVLVMQRRAVLRRRNAQPET